MAHLRNLLVALLLIAGISPVIAQQFPTVPSGTVIGRTLAGTGPAQAIPFSQLLATLLGSNPTIPTVNTSSVVYAGSTSGTATVSAQAVAGTTTIKWPTTSGTVPTSATSPVLLDPVTGIISCPTCVTSTAAASPILVSRALAQTLNLSSFAGLVTAGYTTGGDGGGATFKNVGTAPFIDSQVNSITVSNVGTSCTPGNYFGYDPQGGTGQNLEVNFTIGGGGTMTSASITGTGGGAYTIGDVLTFTGPAPAVPGCSVQPTLTVAGVTTPSGSFTDSVGTHFQIVSQQGAAVANIRQFGAVQNYTHAGGDAGATNDEPAIQSCLRYVAVGNYFSDSGGYSGGVCMVPAGASLVCNGLLVPAQVKLKGAGDGASVLKQCDADSGAANFVNLGDPSNHKNASNAILEDITLFGGGSVMGSGFMVYSNSSQSAYSLNNVAIYSVTRACIKYETGYGGPSGFGVHGGFCVPNGTLSPSPAINLSGNFSFTFDNNWQISVGGSKWAGTAIQLGGGGVFQMNSGAHCENLSTCIDWDGSVGSPMIVSIISSVGNGALDKFISIRTGSITPGVNFQGFSANGTACNVYKVATTSCVSTGNIGGLSSF